MISNLMLSVGIALLSGLQATKPQERRNDTITDLTGATITLNDSLEIPSGYGIFSNLNFTNNNITYVGISIGINPQTEANRSGYLYYDFSVPTIAYSFGSWNDPIYKTIIINSGNDTTNQSLINWFLLNGTIEEDEPEEPIEYGVSSFTFNTEWNYNGPYNTRASENLIQDSNFGNTPGQIIKYTIDLPMFKSNGLEFNQIQIWYFNAYATRFKQNGEYIIVNDTGYGYFNMLYYNNTITNEQKYVNGRLYGTYIDNNGDPQTYVDKGSQWLNYQYKYLSFSEELTTEQSDKLSRLNDLGGYGYNGGAIGNGDVFTLIGLGFGAWTSLFSMQIGGITLSMLIMAPLLIGFIVFLIKLVKRGG